MYLLTYSTVYRFSDVCYLLLLDVCYFWVYVTFGCMLGRYFWMFGGIVRTTPSCMFKFIILAACGKHPRAVLYAGRNFIPKSRARSIRSFFSASNGTITTLVPSSSMTAEIMNSKLLPAAVGSTQISPWSPWSPVIIAMLSLCLTGFHLALEPRMASNACSICRSLIPRPRVATVALASFLPKRLLLLLLVTLNLYSLGS